MTNTSNSSLKQALSLARWMAEQGVPIFCAYPAMVEEIGPDGIRTRVWDPSGGPGGTGYLLPKGWQATEPDPRYVDAWKPGMALCMVTGHGVDLIDIDPRNGGSVSALNGALPRVVCSATTPSGGTHLFVNSLGVRSMDGVMPGIDVKAGAAVESDTGSVSYAGCGFAFLAPTERLSKVTGEITGYAWVDSHPERLGVGDTSGEKLAALISDRRPGPAPGPGGLDAESGLVRYFTRPEAAAFVEPALSALRSAEVGTINARLNDAAITVGHFVGEFCTYEQASSSLLAALSATAYDGATWQASATIASGISAASWKAKLIAGDPLFTEDAMASFRAGSLGDESEMSRPEGVGEPLPDDFASRVEYELFRMRVREEARRRLKADQRSASEPPEILTLRERLARPVPVKRWRISGWQPAGSRVMLAAQYKAGKTTMTGNLARCLVDGTDWLGKAEVTAVSGSVVVLDFEMNGDQIDAWLRDQRIAADDRVVVIPMRGKGAQFDILDPNELTRWAGILRSLSAEYVILDCLRPVMDSLGLDEHSEAGQFLVAFDALLDQAGVPDAVVVHHMGHAGERSRGDSRIRDWPDVEWRLVRESDEPSSARFVTAFGRDVDVIESQLVFDSATRHLVLAGGSRVDAKVTAALRDLLVMLDSADEALSGRAITEAMAESDHGRDVVRRAVELGVRNGSIGTKPGPRSAVLHYRIRHAQPVDNSARSGSTASAHSTLGEDESAGQTVFLSARAECADDHGDDDLTARPVDNHESAGQEANARVRGSARTVRENGEASARPTYREAARSAHTRDSGPCEDRSHSPVLDGDRWTCPDCEGGA